MAKCFTDFHYCIIVSIICRIERSRSPNISYDSVSSGFSRESRGLVPIEMSLATYVSAQLYHRAFNQSWECLN